MYKYEQVPNSIKHDNYFAEMVNEITDAYGTMRDFFVTVNIAYCMHKGEFDLLGGIDKYSANKRIFGIALLGDAHGDAYPKDNFERNKLKFLETIDFMQSRHDLRHDCQQLLAKFLEWSNNIHPRNAVIVQTLEFKFTELGGIIPDVTTKFENKIDYLGKDFMQSNISKLEELYSE